MKSLSSRRAWIEIEKVQSGGENNTVALLTESVDWNVTVLISIWEKVRRSPHGERGLKY